MNWLAHVFLSGQDIDVQLGNLLADPLKGRSWSGAPQGIAVGMALHRKMDRFTDQHAVFKRSCGRLGRQGRLRAVVMDVVYDHFLSRHWSRYCPYPLVDYIQQFHRNALLAAQHHPYKARVFVTRLVLSGRLGQYGSWDGLASTLERMDQRLSPRVRAKEATSDYLFPIEKVYDSLDKDFQDFFPELMSHVNHDMMIDF